jgi:thiol-disulfide isomerase/thioredoxin
MVKLAYDSKMKNPKGAYVVVIYADWCGHCKTLMPKFENEIVTSDDFSKDLEGALTLGSIEEAEYNNHPEKNIFGKIDGYPTIRYIYFNQNGKPLRTIELPADIPHEPKTIIGWINKDVKTNLLKYLKKNKNKTNSKKLMNGGKKTRRIKTQCKNKKIII